jgi:hypothetical protein
MGNLKRITIKCRSTKFSVEKQTNLHTSVLAPKYNNVMMKLTQVTIYGQPDKAFLAQARPKPALHDTSTSILKLLGRA